MFTVHLRVLVIEKGEFQGNIFQREITLPFVPYVGTVILLQVGPSLHRFVVKTLEWMEGFNKFNVALQDINPEQEPEMVFFFPKNWKGLRA